MTPAPAPSTRLDRVRVLLDELVLDAIVVSRNANKRYLAGFVIARGDEPTSGFSGTLVVGPERQTLLADARYVEQAADETPGWEVRRTSGRLDRELAALLGDARRVGLEARVLSHADWSAVAEALPGAELVAVDAPLNALRVVKDEAEVEAVERAAALTDACFGHLIGWLRPGVSERQVAWELDDWFRQHGAEDLAFEPIVLVGPRAAMPHGRPGTTPIESGEPLLIDFGCQVDGYRCDMTRTIFVGEPSERQRELYAAVLEAQRAAYHALRPGMTGRELDAVARASLAEAGLGEAFTHGLGHGIGLETHEAPMLLHHDEPLRPGMVFSLEPGVYLPGEIGIRIEDDVVLTDDGPRYLTCSPRELLAI
ncbi:MAG TPA: Xaa-Pro peptidase family protein [Candidatus Limnocylindria bacterium]|nr:Xaa-Pro peptidase family protein [Candidatus Limnocylindria bacterium]